MITVMENWCLEVQKVIFTNVSLVACRNFLKWDAMRNDSGFFSCALKFVHDNACRFHICSAPGLLLLKVQSLGHILHWSLALTAVCHSGFGKPVCYLWYKLGPCGRDLWCPEVCVSERLNCRSVMLPFAKHDGVHYPGITAAGLVVRFWTLAKNFRSYRKSESFSYCGLKQLDTKISRNLHFLESTCSLSLVHSALGFYFEGQDRVKFCWVLGNTQIQGGLKPNHLWYMSFLFYFCCFANCDCIFCCFSSSWNVDAVVWNDFSCYSVKHHICLFLIKYCYVSYLNHKNQSISSTWHKYLG